METIRRYSFFEMDEDVVYKHIDEKAYFRMYEGKLQRFSCGCWNGNTGLINTKEAFEIATDFIPDGSHNWNGDNEEIKEDTEDDKLKVVSLDEKRIEKQLESSPVPLGKHDFVHEGTNVHLEASYCCDDGIKLSYYRLCNAENLRGFMPEDIKNRLDEISSKYPQAEKILVRYPLETTTIHLTKFERFLNLLPGGKITIDSKLDSAIEDFKEYQKEKLDKSLIILKKNKELEKRIKL